ncbi:MAG: hypothetical protein ISS16_00050 [Ignavibacteria bacterium]|nr:hypothetical protein [Ignavibacteria bacterium]
MSIFLGDAREITTIFDRDLFDVVTSFDLIEHFEKNEGLRLLEDMTIIAKKKLLYIHRTVTSRRKRL